MRRPKELHVRRHQTQEENLEILALVAAGHAFLWQWSETLMRRRVIKGGADEDVQRRMFDCYLHKRMALRAMDRPPAAVAYCGQIYPNEIT